MRRIQELEYVPVGIERAQRPKHRGFLIRLLRAILGRREPCMCPACRLRRGEEVEEQQTLPTIEF